MNIRYCVILFYLLSACLAVHASEEKDAYFFSKVDYQQGLSHSAVLCLFQDNEGLMWFGTYDGVNCWDGRDMEVFRSNFSANTTLSNNVIHSISQADSGCLWIATHLGINRFSRKTRQVVGNYDFQGDYYLNSNSRGNTWVFSDSGIYYYNTYCHRFAKVEKQTLPMESMENRTFVTDDGVLWVFPVHTGKSCRYSLNSFTVDTLDTKLSMTTTEFHNKPIEYVFYQSGSFSFVDCDMDLYIYDISHNSKIYIRNLKSLVDKLGDISGIVPFYEDIIIAFRGNGLVRLQASEKYEEEVINRNIRIFQIYRDVSQRMLWVASDGQGALMYARKYSIATNLMLNRMSSDLTRQVRSVLTTKQGDLWFGTKGDGLLHLPHYEHQSWEGTASVYSPGQKQWMRSYTKWTKEFSVYKLLQSRDGDGIWIGAGAPGLYYYSYRRDDVRAVEYSQQEMTMEVHDIYEENDTTLFAVTSGDGFYKIILERRADDIRIARLKRYRFYHEQQEISMFYPLLADGDSVLWLGSREKGLVCFNKYTDEYRVISLKAMLKKSVDDILSLYRAHDGKMYVGTTSGLVCLTFYNEKIEAVYVGREQGLLNDMIHGILEDDNGLIWLGTNRGLIKYNPENGAMHAYYYSAGVHIGEFSDDAYYRCPFTGRLFFGGIDGLLYLNSKVPASFDFDRDILLRRLWIGRREVNLGDYYTADESSLHLPGPRSSFSLSFVMPDFLAGDEVEYSFMLEGFDAQWTSFSSLNEASYTDVPAGDYRFRVRCKKDVFDTEYKTFDIPIRVLAPWYQSRWVYVSGGLLLLLLVGYLAYMFRKYFLHERILARLLDAEKKGNEVTRGSQRELLNYFTLIYQVCDRLRSPSITYEQRCDQIDLIRETAMGMLFHPATLQSEKLRQFYPVTFVLSARMCINDLSYEVLQTLRGEGVDVSTIRPIISAELAFPVYMNALRCILFCCYRFLCKEQPSEEVTVDAWEEDGRLQLMFSSSGGGLEALYKQLTDKHSLSPDGKEADKMFGNQLMLCFVRSTLERLRVAITCREREVGSSSLHLTFEPAQLTAEKTGKKKNILFLEDRDEMVWLITGLLSEEYTVQAVKSVQTAFEEIGRSSPMIFLADMSMYANMESEFMQYVNNNRSLLATTLFIPMLTWKASSAVQRELILWSDSYIVLPYDILFLREEIHKTVHGKREAKQLYLDDLGELAGQIVCSTSEQADFVRQLLQIIEQNLQREDLGTSLLADRLMMSQSQFYRKFKEFSSVSPSDLIKNYRLQKAARLLVDSDLPIQDVIVAVGVASRSYFYREFARKFGMTPKDYREKGKEGGTAPTEKAAKGEKA